MTMQQDILKEIFGERPELAYQGRLAQAGGRPRFQDFFRQRQQDFMQQFQGQVGRDLLEGKPLDQVTTPESFFGGLDFQSEFRRTAPTQRGFFSANFAPRTRWLTGF
jgi:hypothetical protein